MRWELLVWGEPALASASSLVLMVEVLSLFRSRAIFSILLDFHWRRGCVVIAPGSGVSLPWILLCVRSS